MNRVDRRILIRLALVVAVPMAIVALVPALAGLAIAQHDRAMIRKTVDQQEKLVGSILQVRRAQVQQIAASDRRLCLEIESLKKQIRVTISRSNKTLATIAYYRDHPDELAAAKAYNRAVVKQFAARDCTKLPSQQPPVKPQPPRNGVPG